jgi:hypothetical protein
MINRENGLVEIYERVKANRQSLGIKTFKRTPTQAISEADLPCIFMSEETDAILEHSKRNKHGYPARRVLEVVLEIIVSKQNTNIHQLFSDIRRAVFTQRNTVPVMYSPAVAENTFINENRTEGPYWYNLPDAIGMRFVLDLVYTDKAFMEE